MIVYAEKVRGKVKAVMKKVNEVSRLAGVSKRTLQFYDDEGLLPAQRSKKTIIDCTMTLHWNVFGRFWCIGQWGLI